LPCFVVLVHGGVEEVGFLKDVGFKLAKVNKTEAFGLSAMRRLLAAILSFHLSKKCRNHSRFFSVSANCTCKTKICSHF
jgi:hypothetical protein